MSTQRAQQRGSYLREWARETPKTWGVTLTNCEIRLLEEAGESLVRRCAEIADNWHNTESTDYPGDVILREFGISEGE